MFPLLLVLWIRYIVTHDSAAVTLLSMLYSASWDICPLFTVHLSKKYGTFVL